MARFWEKNEEKNEEEVKLPKAIQDQLDEAKGTKKQVEELSAKLDGLSDVAKYIQEQREKEAALKNKPRVKTEEDSAAEKEELLGLMLSDPEAAYAKMASRTNAGVLQLAAQNTRRELFEDNAEQYPYYTGEIKAEILKELSNQPLSFQANATAVENTYHMVVGRKQKDINEGKIKDRFASGSSTRTTPTTEENDRKKITPNDDVTKIAKQLGFTVDEYVKMMEEDVERYIS